MGDADASHTQFWQEALCLRRPHVCRFRTACVWNMEVRGLRHKRFLPRCVCGLRDSVRVADVAPNQGFRIANTQLLLKFRIVEDVVGLSSRKIYVLIQNMKIWRRGVLLDEVPGWRTMIRTSWTGANLQTKPLRCQKSDDCRKTAPLERTKSTLLVCYNTDKCPSDRFSVVSLLLKA